MKRLLLLITILFSSVTGVYAQTLYWVGGSGSFNDPSHWSMTSGGAPSNLVPNSATDVIFNDKSGSDYITVEFPFMAKVKSLKTIGSVCKVLLPVIRIRFYIFSLPSNYIII
ncbi:MAG: hypothetical protein IPJ32_05910 [Sphingobacteriaceae bacterium]|nr:hypothetical protein [Sphingobacteriaceae bacterium]